MLVEAIRCGNKAVVVDLKKICKNRSSRRWERELSKLPKWTGQASETPEHLKLVKWNVEGSAEIHYCTECDVPIQGVDSQLAYCPKCGRWWTAQALEDVQMKETKSDKITQSSTVTALTLLSAGSWLGSGEKRNANNRTH